VIINLLCASVRFGILESNREGKNKKGKEKEKAVE
jgi:hypothetical protein